MGTTRLVAVTALVILAAACSDAAGDPAPIETSTSVAAPGTEVSAPAPVGSEGPPALRVEAGSSTVLTYGFDYCWTPGGCADSFGSETPTPIDVDAPSVSIAWIDGGELSAGYRWDDDECGARLSLELIGPGTWSLAMPPEPGTYRIDLFGESAEGTTRFSVLASSSIGGPPLLPIASVWWPDTDDEFLMSVNLYGVDPTTEAYIDVVAADRVATVLPIQLYESAASCPPFIEGESVVVGGVGSLGVAPHEATLFVFSEAGQYELTWEWPRDIGRDDTLTGTMVATGSPLSGPALVGAGWSFGMCGGFCLAELVIEATQASLTGRSWQSDEALFVNQGELTDTARAQLDSLTTALEGVALEPVYGCPDCADGGAAYLTLSRGDITTSHSMSFGRPPEELATLYEPAFAIIEALTRCEPNDLVVVTGSCEPQQR
jgi:hypothetical protein